MGLNRNLGNITEVITVSGNNVGVGNPSAIRRLEVASDGSNWISGTFSGTGNTNKVVIGNLVTPTIGGHNSGLGAWSDFTVAGANINFAPYGSTLMILNDQGSLGIGTISPSNKLTVVGASLGNMIKWTDNINNTGYLGIRNIGVSIGSDDDIIFENGGATKMRLYKSGNLYIGTSPVDSVKLKVEDSGVNSIVSLGTTTTTGRTTIDLLTNGYDWEIGARGSANSPANSFYIYNIDTSSYRFIISPTGNVGIGMIPNAARVTVNGAVTIGEFTNGTAWINAEGGAAYFGNGGRTTSLWIYNNGTYYFTGGPASDRRAKENINDLDFNATEKVMALQPKSYYMKSNSKQIKYGFIAQDVHELLPDLICGDLEGEDYVGLDYNGIIPVLTKAIQEQQEIIKQLTNRIINLENK